MTQSPADEPFLEDRGEDVPRSQRKKGFGCLPVLIGVLAVAAMVFVAAKFGMAKYDEFFADAPDYDGPGTGEVVFEVKEGDTSAMIGRGLKAQDVVKSVDAFTDAARANPDSTGIQVGFYNLQKQMPAEDALEVLINPKNRVQNTVTVPEGLRVKDIVALLGQKTDFPARQWRAALDDPAAIGLPDYAQGNPEGYLFPATYEIGPKEKPVDVLSAMVNRWQRAAEDAGLEERARALGKTPAELMVIASLVEAEGRGDDMPKIARVIFNRLDGPGDKRGTNGLLQIDASVNYGLDQKLGVVITNEQKAVDTPYNTYMHPGLPPTPIEAPGDDAIAAAANPAEGDWYYYVTVNLRTGETKFAETYEEFLGYRAEYEKYCETSDAC